MKRNKPVAPPYPRSPHRIATLSDLETRSQRLFGPLKRATDSELIIQQAKHKPIAINREASTVAAYFNRLTESNQLLPPQRKAMQRVNKQFFDLRRALFSDARLNRQGRAQLVSILTFERMKAREAIQSPNTNIEVNFMGSAEIRRLLDDEKEDPGYSISGPKGPQTGGMREQVRRIVDTISKQLDPELAKARERELGAKDLYTRKARFSQNVHYLDKHTDKTLFVDTGKAISLRRTGITESGVAIALKLAQERFGSTLTITGSADFKHLVIEAAAKSGLDVHFTDQAMNQSLAARRAELEIERDGQCITPGVSQPAAQGPAPLTFLHNGQPAILDLDRYRVPAEPETSSTLTAHRDEGLAAQPSSTDPKVIVGELIGHGSAPYKNIPDKEPSYFVTVKTDSGHRTLWGVGLADVMQQTPFNPGDRLRIEDKGSVSVMLQLQQTDGSFIEKPGYRREWAAELETTAKSGPTVEQVSTSSSVLATPSEDHGPEMD